MAREIATGNWGCDICDRVLWPVRLRLVTGGVIFVTGCCGP